MLIAIVITDAPFEDLLDPVHGSKLRSDEWTGEMKCWEVLDCVSSMSVVNKMHDKILGPL